MPKCQQQLLIQKLLIFFAFFADFDLSCFSVSGEVFPFALFSFAITAKHNWLAPLLLLLLCTINDTNLYIHIYI